MSDVSKTGYTGTHPLSPGLLVQTAWRGLFIQAGWNYENYQGIGFSHALVPFLRGAGLSREKIQEVLERHLGCFNTNPYLAGMIVGGTLRLEYERSQGQVTPEQIESFKNDLMGALGALGDSLIWGTLRPLAGLVAVLVAVIFESMAPLVFLILYNSATFWLRISGTRNGYAYGTDLLIYLKTINLQHKMHRMNGLILFLVGALLPLWTFQGIRQFSLTYLGLLAFMGFLIWVNWTAERNGVPLAIQAVGLLLLSGLFAHMGWLDL